MLRLDKDGKIRYNYLQLVGTYKALKSLQEEQIKKAQEKNLKTIYILKSITKEFIKEFHRNLTQKHNRVIALATRLQEKYIINRIYKIARKITKECLDCQRNKFNRHKPYREL